MPPQYENWPALSIGAVERDTGLSKDILRVWERRYGFPSPARDVNGDRVYPQAQVDKLRTIRRLIDQGMRPGKLIPKTLQQLQDLAHNLSPDAPIPQGHEATVSALIDLLRHHQVDDLRQRLKDEVRRLGLYAFVTELVAALACAVGEAWVVGKIAIHEEHLYSHVLSNLLHAEISELGFRRKPPRVVLATFPEESHTLGLLMAEALFGVEGAGCVSLGAELPVYEIVEGAAANAADIVGVSFSSAYPANQIAHGVADLRALLPAECELWVGGAGAARLRRVPPGVLVVTSLTQVRPMLKSWRERRSGERAVPAA